MNRVIVTKGKPTHKNRSSTDDYYLKQLTYKVEMLIKKVDRLLCK